MMVIVALTTGLVVWVVAWAFGIKAFDAFLFTAFLTVSAAGAQIAMPYVTKILKGAPARPE